jgi:cellulose synthase/poly-beta-1,6-N-acetylglucosamine synthase-like glycosyltransferase
MDILPTIFWLSAGMVVYAYLGYPILVWCAARRWDRRALASPADDDRLPTATLLIAAHNEAEVIEARLRNALALDYPADKLEIVIASDGSSDGTSEIVRRFVGPRVRLLDFSQRRGKTAVLNDAVRQLGGELVMFSDANTMWRRDTARRLASWFSTADVGMVCGRLVLTDPATGSNVDGLYWRYETFLKTQEGRLGAVLGANGAVYAMRRSIWRPVASDTIVDDLVIPLSAYLKSRCRMVYDPSAVAGEETPAELTAEFGRRARIGAGGFQAIGRLAGLLHPRHGWLALAFLSHKLLRWFAPFCLIAALAANLTLARDPVYGPLLGCQLAFYLTAAVGSFLPGRHLACRVIRAATLFTSMNLALLVGYGRWLSGRQGGVWRRTARSVAPLDSRPAPASQPQPLFPQGVGTYAHEQPEAGILVT